MDLGPARARPCRSGSSTTWPRRSATTPTRGSTGSGSGWSCRRSCARSAARGRPPRWPRTSPPTTRSGRADGWMSDGPERAYDHYVGWALHLYPTLWARMAGAADLAAARRDRDVAALDRFLRDAVALVGADGSPLIQGRSLIYRFAAAAPFWVGALAGVPSVSRRASCAHAADQRRARTSPTTARPTTDGLLTLGWHGAVAAAGPVLLRPGLALLGEQGAARHRAAGRPSGVDRRRASRCRSRSGDTLRAVRAPGLAGRRHPRRRHRPRRQPRHRPRRRGRHRRRLAALRPAGLLHRDQPGARRERLGRPARPVRRPGRRRGPAPRTAPACARSTVRVDGRRRRRRLDRRSRTGWTRTRASATTAAAAPGRRRPAGRITVVSLVRGPWELRLARVDDSPTASTPPAAAADRRLAGRRRRRGRPSPGGAAVTGGRPDVSRLRSSDGAGTAGRHRARRRRAARRPGRVPWLDHAVARRRVDRRPRRALRPAPPAGRQAASCSTRRARLAVRVDWPDGVGTRPVCHRSARAHPQATWQQCRPVRASIEGEG